MQPAHKEEVTCSRLLQLPRLSRVCVGAWMAVGILGCEKLSAHQAVEITQTEERCVTCHRSDYEAAVAPLHVQELPLQCEMCHDDDTWSPALGSNHDEFFERRLAHAEAGCGDCHQGAFGGGETPTACVGCHRDDYERAARPPHEGLPTNCTLCHDERAFSPSNFDHEVVGFPLLGQHATTMCTSCHGVEPTIFEGTPSECISCHEERAELASPPHEFEDLQCGNCHSTQAFKPSTFIHPWELTGAHLSVSCTSCHQGDSSDLYGGLDTECYKCHMEDFDAAELTVPGHKSFGLSCSTCHSTDGW